MRKHAQNLKVEITEESTGLGSGNTNAPPFSPNQDLFLLIQIPTQRGDKDNPTQI